MMITIVKMRSFRFALSYRVNFRMKFTIMEYGMHHEIDI